MNPAIPIIAACVALSPPEATPAIRGLASQVDVNYAPRLRARADQTPNSPILVRVTPGPASKQRIEFIGAVAGIFDLRNYLEREDGQPLTDLPPLPVDVVSQLPADHGMDLYGTTSSWMNWRAHYRGLMWIAIGLWAAVPATVFVVRRIRRPRPAPPPPLAPPPPSIADQLRAALETARERPLTVEESGQLELLLLRFLGGDTITENTDLATVLRDVRANETTRPLVLAVERWLHAKNGGESARTQAAAALEELHRTRLASYQPPPAAQPVEASV